MRDILNKLEPLTEASRGLLFRDPGDKFIQGPISAPTAEMTFLSAKYFPKQPGKFNDLDQTMLAADRIKKVCPGLEFVNVPNNGTLSFAVLTFQKSDGTKQYYGRFFKEITTNMAGQWKNNGLPGGWQLTKQTSLKAAYGLKPADFWPEGKNFPNALSLVTSLQDSGKINDMIPGFQMLLGGNLPIFEGKAEMVTAIQDDLGEIIAPIALAQGMITDSGATAIKKDLLAGADWKNCSFEFPKEKNFGLVDSYVTVNGVQIGVSSKGKKGAAASIKNVLDGVNIAKTSVNPAHKKLLTKYAEQIKLVNKIGSLNATDFPIDYAVRHEIISQSLSNKIKELIKINAKSLDEVVMSKKDRKELENYMSYLDARTELQNYNVGHHVLAVLAKDVAADINSDPKFGTMCLQFVNINPIIQIYLTATKKKDDAVITKLTSLYPPNFQGTIVVDARKSYAATGANGRLTFIYEPDKAAANKQQADDQAATKRQLAIDKKVAKIDQKIAKIAAGTNRSGIKHPDAVKPRAKRDAPPREKR